MKPFNRNIAFIAVLLFMSIGNYFRMSSGITTIRTVDFLSIFAIGMLAGLLIGLIVSPKRSE
jgi:uncharacterized membrane protein